MSGEAYDHLMAAVVLGAIFIASVFVVPSISYVNLLYIDQQQLQNIALSAMNTILFDEGYPSNWGSMHGTNMFNELDVKRFGLSAINSPSLYIVDPNKVYRLNYNPMGNISYTRARELLGLSGYGFSLIFRPLFNVTRNVKVQISSAQTSADVTFSANVSRYDGQPVPNALVRATIIYAFESSSKGYVTGAQDVVTTTDALGKCTRSVTINADGKISDVIVFFRVTVAGRSTLVASAADATRTGDIAKINVVGDHLILTMPDVEQGSHEARWITNILMYNFETSVNLMNGTGTGNTDHNKLNYGSSILWNSTFNGLDASEPGIFIMTFRAEIGSGRQLVVMIGPYGLWGQGGVMRFNDVPVSSGASASVRRDVVMAGMAYNVELRLWKT